MFGNKRRTIGVFVTQEHQETQRALTKGICMRAKELGYNVAFFTCFSEYTEEQYESGEISIADLPWFETFDGIILLPDIWYREALLEKVFRNIKKYSNCPVVCVNQRHEEFYNVLINDDAILDEIIRHMIEEHGYRRINFLTGPEDNSVSYQRLEAYKRILTQYSIPIEEDRIYFGDFWKIKPKEAVRLWFADPKKWPEAIICANDYMAITVCNALEERGISVPEDVAVTGCDNLCFTEDFYPTITTTGMPFLEMGVEAVDKIDRQRKGIAQQQNTIMNAVTRIRESCGCKQNRYSELSAKRRNRLVNEMDSREKDISYNAFMSIGLTNVETIDELDHKLTGYVNMNESFTHFYMCLNQHWDRYNKDNLPEHDLSEMIMEFGIKNGKVLGREEFKKPDLLPPSAYESEPQVFLFNILHYQEVCFGYTAIAFQGLGVYKPTYQGWLINICNALENIRIHNELNRLVYKLEDMNIKDALTDLYNRRALDVLGKQYLSRCVEEKSKLMVFTADMDKLKAVNDSFGHAGGDIAIKAIADALKYAAEDDEICMRIGGDEFVVIGMDYEERKMEGFLKKFKERMDSFNRNTDLGFQVSVSCGYSITEPDQHTTIEDCLIIADSRMYQQKYEKKALRCGAPVELSSLKDMG
jgi:diguanylate cyclase (GGDEF)-like protein